MLTVSSSSTFRSTFEITKTLPPLPTVCSRPDIEQAYGSFIPVRSAAKCLRDFAGDHTTSPPRIPKKRRRVTFQETSSPVSSDDDDIHPSLTISYQNRPSPEKGYQSPVMSIKVSQDSSPAGIHPILAKLEKDSKFCTQMVFCSTCEQPGRDYPRCGKCGVMWCSRTCRLVAGKRHICHPLTLP